MGGAAVAACSVRLPPANSRRRSIDRLRPDWPETANADAGAAGALAEATGKLAATGLGAAAAWLGDTVGTAALRSPVRTRSVAGGSADLPWDSARRRASAALRPLDERELTAVMDLSRVPSLAGARAVDDEGGALRLRVIVVAEQAYVV